MVIFFFFIGLVVGSFLNSVVYRLGRKESIVKGRSYCPYCKRRLSCLELIPLVSFLFQQGKCMGCKKKISWQYPLVELATGILFSLVIFNLQFSIYNLQNIISVIFWLFIVSCLIIIFVYDLKHYIIPDGIVYPAILVAILYQLFRICLSAEALAKAEDLGFGILPTLFFIAIVLFSRGHWMGGGDIKLALFVGLILGWPNIVLALFLAFLIGALVSVILIILRKKTLKSQIPFGPFLVTGTFIAMFWGNILIDWYLEFFI